jgi:hypothetical protein
MRRLRRGIGQEGGGKVAGADYPITSVPQVMATAVAVGEGGAGSLSFT